MKPKLLGLDVETSPTLAYVWKLFDENIGINQIVRPGRIICWGAKWFGEGGFHYAEARTESGQLAMIKTLHDLMSKADAVVTYNGDKFDLRKINGAFVSYGLPPLRKTPSIDLIKTVRRLGLQSSRLEYVAPFLQIGAKVNAGGFKLWSDCLDGDPKAWVKMKRYNEQDVRLLEKLHAKLLPFIPTYPALYPSPKERPLCPYCGGAHLQSRGHRVTQRCRIERFQCMNPKCGRWPDGKKTVVK